MTVGPVAVWVTARSASAPVREVRERPRFVAGGCRRGVHAHTDAGDDAEYAFGADQQLAEVRARRGLRRPAQVEDAGGCHRAQAANHVVEPAVSRRVLPRRPGRGESADRRELEALWEVPERETEFAEQAFGLRARDARAQFGLAGDLVERVQLVQPAQVERYHGLELAAQRIESTHDAGAAAERDDGDAALPAHAEDLGHVFFVGGQEHRVRCVLDSGIPSAQQVERGLAACTEQPCVVVDAAVFGADDLGERVAVGG